MKSTIIELAYGGLLHDIGKFYQRTYTVSNLTNDELAVTPINNKGGYHDHLHSGYTSRFLKKYLNFNNSFEKNVSEHHKDDEDELVSIIKKADYLASAIDRQDELYDTKDNHKRGSFITARLYSAINDVSFGKEKKEMVFPLSDLDNMSYPVSDFQKKDISESSQEYKDLFNQLVDEVEKNISLQNHINYKNYHYMYNLFNRYLVTIPASTYGNVKSSVSLFDHLKLTSAIAGCLYYEECLHNNKFCMLEIDVSGIQKFIYQVVEGSETKNGLAKALRGRSALVGIITNSISYAFINEFQLTESNILYNTGGGALILLPYLNNIEERVNIVSKKIKRILFQYFQTDITFVSAMIEVSGEELERFQSDKSMELKEKLGRNKMIKFSDIIDEQFFFEKIDNNDKCKICGRPSAKSKCVICQWADDISYVYTKYSDFGIIYDFHKSYKKQYIKKIDLEFVDIYFVDDNRYVIEECYVDAVNHFDYGVQKQISNMVPIGLNDEILNFEQIIQLTPKNYGDDKLAILKMDVDNLGGIFAFGLKNEEEKRKQRSISKYVTMSRLFEHFFGNEIKKICQGVSLKLNPEVKDIVKNNTMFYINYAGGDDLVIIGSAYSIIELSLAISKKFNQYTGNDNVTISGGIYIQNDKKPVRFGIQNAEISLDMSKNKDGKNAITIIDTTIPFEDYEKILDEANQYANYIRDEKISRTMIYNIMSFIDNKTYDEFIRTIPRIQYVLFRNIDKRKNNDIYLEMKQRINEISQSNLKYFVLILKLAIMFTRENSNGK